MNEQVVLDLDFEQLNEALDHDLVFAARLLHIRHLVSNRVKLGFDSFLAKAGHLEQVEPAEHFFDVASDLDLDFLVQVLLSFDHGVQQVFNLRLDAHVDHELVHTQLSLPSGQVDIVLVLDLQKDLV